MGEMADLRALRADSPGGAHFLMDARHLLPGYPAFQGTYTLNILLQILAQVGVS